LVDKYVPLIVSSSQAGERMGEIEFQGGAQSVFEQASELGEQAGEHMCKMTEQAGKRMDEIDFQGGGKNALAQASELGEQAGEHMSKMTEQAGQRMGEIGFQGGAQPYASVEANDVAQYASAAASEAKQWAEGAGVFQAVSDVREFSAHHEATQQAAVLGGAALETAQNVIGSMVLDSGMLESRLGGVALETARNVIGSMVLDSGMLESGLLVNTPYAFLL